MRTPEEIRAAKATYDDYQKATETSSLPDGYIVGFEISTDDTDVTIGPGIAKINGRTVVKASTTNIQDMDWAAKKINSTYYYIYLNRYGFWFVDVLEPENIDGKYGLYRLEIGDRYIGGVYVDSDGTYSKVVSHKRIRAEDISFNSITGNEVNASTINISGLQNAGALASLDGDTLIYASITAPEDPSTTPLWVDTSVTPHVLKRYNSDTTSWEAIATLNTGALADLDTITSSYMTDAGALATLDDIDLSYVTDAGNLASLDTITLAYVTNAGNLAALDTINSSALLADNVVSLAKLGNTVISGGYILTSLINADVIQTKILEATGAVVIGYEGTGTVSSPDEGDRRVYIDGDEVGFQIYADGAWTGYNQVKLGGADIYGNFAPFLTCRGVLNPLAGKVNSLSPPQAYEISSCEESLGTGLIVTGAHAKYGSYSNTSSDSTARTAEFSLEAEGYYDSLPFYTLTESYLYYTSYPAESTDIIEEVIEDMYNIWLRLQLQHTSSGGLSLSITEFPAGNSDTLSISTALDLNAWNDIVIGVNGSYDSGPSCTIYVIINGDEYSTTFVPTNFIDGDGGPWGFFRINGYNIKQIRNTTFLDGVTLLASDMSIKDVARARRNADIWWNGGYQYEDIILLPAEGGEVKSPYNWKVDTLWTGSETSGTHSLDSGAFSDYDLLIFYVQHSTAVWMTSATISTAVFIAGVPVSVSGPSLYLYYDYVSDTSFDIPAYSGVVATRIEGVKL